MTNKKALSSKRVPFTKKELEKFLPSEILKFKLTEGEIKLLKEINAEREQKRIKRTEAIRLEQELLLADLRRIGWDVSGIWDMVSLSTPYPEAVPVLLKHLVLPYSDVTRDGIARALAIPEPAVRQAWPVLIEEYRKAPMGRGITTPNDTEEFQLGVKDGLACALCAIVTDETLPEYIDLLKDKSHGEYRILLLSALRKSKNPLAKQAIEELADDPDLKKEIAAWKKKK